MTLGRKRLEGMHTIPGAQREIWLSVQLFQSQPITGAAHLHTLHSMALIITQVHVPWPVLPLRLQAPLTRRQSHRQPDRLRANLPLLLFRFSYSIVRRWTGGSLGSHRADLTNELHQFVQAVARSDGFQLYIRHASVPSSLRW